MDTSDLWDNLLRTALELHARSCGRAQNCELLQALLMKYKPRQEEPGARWADLDDDDGAFTVASA
jgi:hypothetical protein